MTDEQITTTIAEKVMGYEVLAGGDPDDPVLLVRPMKKPPAFLFDPLNVEADCMAAWDRFSKQYRASLECIGGDCCWVAYWAPRDQDWDNHGSSHEDRRRAMCECMVKAVSE